MKNGHALQIANWVSYLSTSEKRKIVRCENVKSIGQIMCDGLPQVSVLEAILLCILTNVLAENPQLATGY